MRKRNETSTDPELNLAPIMNMVVILIPLLLLSVVFISAAVINVSTPTLTPGPRSDSEPSEDPRVTLALGATGVVVTSRDGELARFDVEDRGEFRTTLQALEQAAEKGDRAAEDAALAELSDQYAWANLYRAMVEAKRKYPSASAVHVAADSDLPYAIVVKAMDAVRFRLPDEAYADDRAFWAANTSANRRASAAPLFADPILTVSR